MRVIALRHLSVVYLAAASSFALAIGLSEHPAWNSAAHTGIHFVGEQGATAAIALLLARVPQLKIDALPAPPGCCGAAGDYFLRHPDIADTLRSQTLDGVLATQAKTLVTSNVGCRIFLDNGLRGRESPTAVIHPLVLLARQLEN